jgi:Cu/Ag efflux protein CusF
MKSWTALSAGLALSLSLVGGSAFAQGQPTAGRAPEMVQGQVVKIDKDQKKVTIQGQGGQTYEFEASDETLKDLKVGDRIEARLRK